MNQTVDSRKDFQTVALLADLLRMQGSRCKECAAPLCSHESLMSIVAGCQDSPRCLSCLALLMGEGREEVRDHLLGYIRGRSCRRAAWLWGNQEEGFEPDELPGCLWPASGAAVKESQLEQSTNVPPDSHATKHVPDAEWDAGNMGCGELVMGLRMRLHPMTPGQILKLTARDPGVPEDLPAWCRLTGHQLVSANHPEYLIRRREN